MNFLDLGNAYSNIASLSHTVIFHGEAETINLVDTQGRPKDFCIEGIVEHISHGRALVNTKLWDVATGKPVASSFQDGMVRMKPGVVQSSDGQHSLFMQLPRGGRSEKL
jgi:acyl-CoA thioesterase